MSKPKVPWSEPGAAPAPTTASRPQHSAAESSNAPKEEAPAADHKPFVAQLEVWEQELNQLSPQQADGEFGQVRDLFMKVGERVGRRLAAAQQNRCAKCNKPLPARGPVDTIPIPAPETAAGWRNQFACSAKCADALRVAMHDRELKRLAEAQV